MPVATLNLERMLIGDIGAKRYEHERLAGDHQTPTHDRHTGPEGRCDHALNYGVTGTPSAVFGE
jgi:hypothetical protein